MALKCLYRVSEKFLEGDLLYVCMCVILLKPFSTSSGLQDGHKSSHLHFIWH